MGPTLRGQVRHAIFDMDGVLLDTERCYTAASAAILGRFGKTYDWSVKEMVMGRPALEAARYVVEALELPLTPEAYLEQREALLLPLVAQAAALPGAEELTRELHRHGVPMAVATSTHRRLYERKSDPHRRWFGVFSAVVCGDDQDVARGKPAPDIFLVAAERIGARPSSCVVVEDSPAGVEAALAAGMRVVAVPDPHMDRARYAGADFIVDSLAECTLEDLGLEVG
jgi:pseudouridine 5'-phosphatase